MVAAVTIVTEVGESPDLESASADGVQRRRSERALERRRIAGRITKTGNAHLRRVVIEAAWAYRHRPAVGPRLETPSRASEEVKAIAWKAQHRLHARYRALDRAGQM